MHNPALECEEEHHLTAPFMTVMLNMACCVDIRMQTWVIALTACDDVLMAARLLYLVP